MAKTSMDDMKPKRGRKPRPKAEPARVEVQMEMRQERVKISSPPISYSEPESYSENPSYDVPTSPLGLRARPPREPLISGRPPKKERRSYLVWIVSSCLLALALFYGLSSFARVRVVAVPSVLTKSIASSILLSKITESTFNSTSSVLYDLYLPAAESASETLMASGTEEVSIKASGEIIVFNNYSKTPVTLIANTRFQSANGNIYRIKDQIAVPGMKTSGNNTTPGSLTVRVWADQPGPEYNIKLSDFTIPGFKGSAQYDKVYARSKTEISGGKKGVSAVLNQNDKDAARKRLTALLEEKVNLKKDAEIPSGFVLLPGLSSLVWTEKETIDPNDPKKAIFEVTGQYVGVAAKEDNLSFFLAKGAGITDPENYKIENLETLSIKNEREGDDVTQSKTLSIRVEGEGSFVADIPINEIRRKIAGKEKKSLDSVMSEYQNLGTFTIHPFPFWIQTMPKEEDRINVTVEEKVEKLDE